MPAAVPIIGAVSGLATTGIGVANAISQGKQANNYAKQIQNYQRQTLVNPFANLQVSTLGADRQLEDASRYATTYGNLAALSGSRGIASFLPNLAQAQNDQSAKITANLDEQQKQIDQLKAQGDMQVQGMMEQRQNNDLLGLGQAYQTSLQNKQNGWNMAAQGIGTLGYAAANGMFNGNPKIDTDPNGFNSMEDLPGATVERIPVAGGASYPLNQPLLPNSVQQFNIIPPYFNTKLGGVVQTNPLMQSIYRDWQLNNNSF